MWLLLLISSAFLFQCNILLWCCSIWLDCGSGTESPCCRSHLQIPVVILAEELQEAKDGLHDDDDKTHLPVVLVLVPRAGLAVRRVEVLLGVGVTPVGVEGLLGGGWSFQQLLSHVLCHDHTRVPGWAQTQRLQWGRNRSRRPGGQRVLVDLWPFLRTRGSLSWLSSSLFLFPRSLVFTVTVALISSCASFMRS